MGKMWSCEAVCGHSVDFGTRCNSLLPLLLRGLMKVDLYILVSKLGYL